jgi:hypothetical protein
MGARYLVGRFVAMIAICLVGGLVVLTGAGAAVAGEAAGAAKAAGAGGSSGPDGAAIRAAAAQPAALVTDTGMGMSTKVGLPAPAMSGAMLAANAAKQVLASSFVKAMRADAAAVSKCANGACPSALPASKSLKLTQRPQLNSYYCGPATVSEMLAQMGKTVGQRKAARELGTNGGGTGWSDGSGYPVPEVLNANQSRNSYVAVGLPWSPTRHEIKTYEVDLVTDINHNGGVPLAGDAYEVAGGPHLVGHPVNQTIFHWFDIRGYKNSGATTDYEDSVHGASSIGWAATVPAYSSLPSSTIVNIVGARGYDW